MQQRFGLNSRTDVWQRTTKAMLAWSRAQVDQLRLVADTMDAQRKEGVASQLEVFETERSLLGAQLALLANQQQILSDTVTLYKALGGGWPPVEVADAQHAG